MTPAESIQALNQLTADWKALFVEAPPIHLLWSLSDGTEPWIMLNGARIFPASALESIEEDEARTVDYFWKHLGYSRPVLECRENTISIGDISIHISGYTPGVKSYDPEKIKLTISKPIPFYRKEEKERGELGWNAAQSRQDLEDAEAEIAELRRRLNHTAYELRQEKDYNSTLKETLDAFRRLPWWKRITWDFRKIPK